MPAAFWYLGLIIISISMIIAALLYRRDWRLLVLHLSVFGIIHPFEVVVMSLRGYIYKPGIFLTPESADNFLGAYISDLFIVPASAVVIQALSLSRGWILCIATVFTGIDWLFTALDIYQHFWWRSVYTGIGLIILYAISGWLWTNLQARRHSLLFRLIVIHLTYSAILSALTFAVNRGGQLFDWYVPFLEFLPEKGAVPISAYQLVVSITVVICAGLKMPWRYRILGIGVIVALDWAIAHFGLFVPIGPITSHHLILFPLGAMFFLMVLFRAAKLDFLFP